MLKPPSGRIRVCRGGVEAAPWTDNTLLYGWAPIAVHRLTTPDSPYWLNTLYIEYANVADPGDPVSTPVVGRDDGLNYYAALASVPDRDYLRVPTVGGPEFGTIPGTEATLGPGWHNLAVVRGTTANATAGVHGRPYGLQSKLCGLALASAPNRADPSADLIYGRAYWSPTQQVATIAGTNLTVEYEISFP